MPIDTGPLEPGAVLSDLGCVAVFLGGSSLGYTFSLLEVMSRAPGEQDRRGLERIYPREYRAMWLWQQARAGVTALELATLLEVFPPELPQPGPDQVAEEWPANVLPDRMG